MKLVRYVSAALDLTLAGAALAAFALGVFGKRILRGRTYSPAGGPPRLLVLDTMYTLRALRTRQFEHMVTWRDLNGFFDHVWSVHPIFGAARGEPAADDLGSPEMSSLNPKHSFISGKTRRFRALSRFPYLNFVLAQAELVTFLSRLIDRERISLVRGDPYYSGLLVQLLGYLHKLPVELRVITNGDALYKSTGQVRFTRLFRWRWVEQRVTRFNFSRADAIVIGGDDLVEFALANHARPDTIVRVSGNLNLVDPVHFRERDAREPLEDIFGFRGRPIVVCVSRLEPDKHAEDVLESVAKARRYNQEIVGILVGDGTLMGKFKQLREQLGLQDAFVLAGERDQPWIARLLPMCAVTAMPFGGLSLVEASLSELPIVAYDHDWHPEIIQDGVSGILVPNRDTDAMAKAICDLVDDPELAERIGRAGRRHVLKVMDPAKMLEHEIAIASRLLNRESVGGTQLRQEEAA